MGEGTQPPVVSTSDRGAGELVLMRAGHYFDAGNGACFGATIAHVEPDGSVNLSVLPHDGSDPFRRQTVPHVVAPALEDDGNSFHLTRECPWGR